MIAQSPHEWETLVRNAQAGDKQAMDEMVRSNLALVRFVAKRFRGAGREAEDIFQYGCMGLVKAIRHFNPAFSVQFSTYAVPVILGEIRRYLRDDGPMRVARSIKDNARRIAGFTERYEREQQRTPTLLEIAEATGLSAEDALLALDSLRPTRSLSEPIGTDDHLTLGDTVGEDRTEEIDRRILVSQLLQTLPPREREILLRRYRDGLTQTQVGQAFGMSQVQVSRLESKLLRQLREAAGEAS